MPPAGRSAANDGSLVFLVAVPVMVPVLSVLSDLTLVDFVTVTEVPVSLVGFSVLELVGGLVVVCLSSSSLDQ